MQLFYFYSYDPFPTGIGLGLPSNFALSKVIPAQVPLQNVEVAERARRWVDIMTTNTSVFLYSEAVVRMVEEEGFTGIEFFPVEVSKVEGKHLRVQTPWPRYYVGRITGRIGAVVSSARDEPLSFDEKTGMYQPQYLETIHIFRMNKTEWDQSDFCHVSTFGSLHSFCTPRAKAAIEKRKLHNFNFISEREPDFFRI